MLRLASDADFNGIVYRALLRRQPDLDILRAQDVGLRTAPDPDVLAWSASEGRLLLSHDRSTITQFAYERVRAGLPMPGVLIVPNQGAPIGALVDDILLVALGSSQDEWANRVGFLPL